MDIIEILSDIFSKPVVFVDKKPSNGDFCDRKFELNSDKTVFLLFTFLIQRSISSLEFLAKTTFFGDF